MTEDPRLPPGSIILWKAWRTPLWGCYLGGGFWLRHGDMSIIRNPSLCKMFLRGADRGTIEII